MFRPQSRQPSPRPERASRFTRPREIAELGLDESKNFVKLRQTVRQALAESPYAEELDQLVRLLLE
ncbi:hypothetical protein GCM10020367_70670 [Streptomyces sannanensis]|uniref:Uncharacterized protein n=1 Tax=Streptomyces sannanensis TaxID=285536 RepID=A0ABP6SPM5_9ACTN